MKQVAGWEAVDGSFHRTERGARAVDAALAVERWVEARGIGRGGEWSADMILRAMLKDAEVLGALLTDVSVAREAAGTGGSDMRKLSEADMRKLSEAAGQARRGLGEPYPPHLRRAKFGAKGDLLEAVLTLEPGVAHRIVRRDHEARPYACQKFLISADGTWDITEDRPAFYSHADAMRLVFEDRIVEAGPPSPARHASGAGGSSDLPSCPHGVPRVYDDRAADGTPLAWEKCAGCRAKAAGGAVFSPKGADQPDRYPWSNDEIVPAGTGGSE